VDNAKVTWETGWTGTDVPSAICGFVCIYCGFAAATRDDRDLSDSFLLFFAGFTTALKLSGAVVALFPLGLTAIATGSFRGANRQNSAGERSVPAVDGPQSGGQRLSRLSGFVDLPFGPPWEASRAATHAAMWIKAWARAPNTELDHLSGWAWIPIWFERVKNKEFLISWAEVAVFGVALAAAIGRVRPDRPVPLGQIVVFTVYAVVASVFWFLAAPDPRFGIGHLLALALLSGLWLLATGRPALIRIPAYWMPMLLLAVPLVIAVRFSWRNGVNEERSLFGFHAVRFARVETTTEGVVRPPPVADDRCFLAPPPCSPEGANLESKLGSYRAYIVAK
jgi:hypothetical protein